MKFPLGWLNEYIETGLSPNELGKLLTSIGIEVDAIHPVLPAFEGVVVGKVTHTEKHPNADKLCVATVSTGTETFQVVCGAPNCRPGLKTAFAKVGAKLPGDSEKEPFFIVKKAKLRGVESSGMLCSSAELKLGLEADGIIELDPSLPEGTDFASLYTDMLFEVALTPNLAHCASIMGIARELSAATGKPLKIETAKQNNLTGHLAQARITVEDQKACPRYTGCLIKDIKIGPSPHWLQQRLLLSGQRPINNVVDAVNYVVLELGHPLHAFDLDQIAGSQIIVRRAKEGETCQTLDGKERILSSHDLLICDTEKPLAIAGVMGGSQSEVSEQTKHLLLESAYFSPQLIRKTSKKLGLSTDASKRFERGTDPNQLLQALTRAASLIVELSGGHLVQGMIDTHPEPFPMKEIKCRLSRINLLLGTQLSLSEVESIFQRLNFSMRLDSQESFLIKVPTYRGDITQEIDLIEEVARFYGYDNIPKRPAQYESSRLADAPIFLFEREVRRRAVSEGLQELLCCDLIGPSILGTVYNDFPLPLESIKVLNPTSIEQSVLRTSLLPGLLQTIKYNYDHQIHSVHGFEVGRIHYKADEAYKEPSMLGIILTGNQMPAQWSQQSKDVDFFTLKGILENILEGLSIQQPAANASSFSVFHPGRQASLFIGSLEIGSMGEIHPAILRRLDLPQRVFFAELNLHDLMQMRKTDIRMKPLELYPASERDLTITLREETAIQEIFSAIYQVSPTLLESVSLVDIYRSDKLGHGLKNATFHFVYRDHYKTVERDVVEAEHLRLVSEIKSLKEVVHGE